MQLSKGTAAVAFASLSIVVALAQVAEVRLMSVARGAFSGIADATEVVVRSNADWEKLWKSHAGAQPLPEVDFAREMIASVFLGSRPTGGFSVEIVGARRDGDTLVIEYAERRPPPDAIVTQALTAPFHIVRLEAHAGPVRFRRLATAARPRG